MSPIIESLFIPFVELYVDADYIMDVFYTNSIASVSRVTFENDGSAYKRAYVDIYEWHDSEIAYNFIKRLKEGKIETRLIHSDDDWWNVKINYKKESFYLNEETTFINYLVEGELFEISREAKTQEWDEENDRRQDVEDWKEIENMIDTSLKSFRLEFSY